MTILFRVKLAFGADLTINSASWIYTDLTARALGAISWTFGSPDEATNTTPGTAGFVLSNVDGWLSPHNPNSAFFPYVRRQTPVQIDMNPGTGFVNIFQGFVDAISPDWPGGNATFADVSIVASGSLRRLNQGSPVLRSAIYRSTVAADPVAFAPLEEDSGATVALATGRVPNQNAIFAGTVSFAADTTLPGAKQAIVLNATSYMGLATSYVYSGQWQVDWFMKWTGGAPGVENIIMRVYTNSTLGMFVDAVYGGGNWGIRVYDSSGTSSATGISAPPTLLVSEWWHWRIFAKNIGATTVQYSLVVFPALGGTGNVATANVSPLSGPGDLTACAMRTNAIFNGVAMSSLAIYDRANYSAVDASSDAYAGESASVRLARLCREEGIEATISNTSAVTMGPQRPLSFLTLIRESETADQGVLYDGVTAGLTYLAHNDRYNRAVALALDCKQAQVKLGFAPTEDDQSIVNDWTVTRPGGGTAFAIDPSHIFANGRYSSSIESNVETDGLLIDDAGWRLHLGTVDEMRVRQVSLQLVDHPELWASALALRPGHRLTVTNLMSQYPPGTLDLVCEGFTATADATSWRMDINCSPYSPWDVGVMDTNRLDCANSVLGTSMTTSTTSIDVLVSDGCFWTHADGDFGIIIGGEEMTVTAVGATTTPTPALVAVGTSATADAIPVTPGLPGGATAAGNLMLLQATVRDINAIDTDMYLTGAAGWERILDGVQMAVFAKVHNGAEVAPTLHFRSDIVGDCVIAQIASFSGKWGDPRKQLIAMAQQVNGTDQDIGYPALQIPLSGTLAVWTGWKGDDWTSVATIGGATEISEPSSTFGNDSGQVWDYQAQATPTTLTAGSFVVTGGTSQVSRGAAFALRSVYQTLTVVRGVNGITKTHAPGEDVHVARPLILSKS